MTKTINGKNVRIPEAQVAKIAAGLGVSFEEAIQIWIEDEGLEANAEQEALCKKAKESGVMRTIHGATSEAVVEKKMASPAKKPKTSKDNPTKEKIIADIAALLGGYCDDVTVVNKGKIIEFSYGGNSFKLDLTQRRAPKN